MHSYSCSTTEDAFTAGKGIPSPTRELAASVKVNWPVLLVLGARVSLWSAMHGVGLWQKCGNSYRVLHAYAFGHA